MKLNKKVFLTLIPASTIVATPIVASSCLIRLDKTIKEAYEYGKNHDFNKKPLITDQNSSVEERNFEKEIRSMRFAKYEAHTFELNIFTKSFKSENLKKIPFEKAKRITDYYFKDTPYAYLFYSRNILSSSPEGTVIKDITVTTPTADNIDKYYFNEFIKAINAKDDFKTSYENLLKAFVKNNVRINETLNREVGAFAGFPLLYPLQNLNNTYKSGSDADKIFKNPITKDELIKEYIQNPTEFISESGKHKDLLFDSKKFAESFEKSSDKKKYQEKYRQNIANIKNYGTSYASIARLFTQILYFKDYKDIQLLKVFNKTTKKFEYVIEKKNGNHWEVYNFSNDLDKLLDKNTSSTYKITPLTKYADDWTFEVDKTTDTSNIVNYVPDKDGTTFLSKDIDEWNRELGYFKAISHFQN